MVVMQMGEWTSSGYKDGCLLSCGPIVLQDRRELWYQQGIHKRMEWKSLQRSGLPKGGRVLTKGISIMDYPAGVGNRVELWSGVVVEEYFLTILLDCLFLPADVSTNNKIGGQG